MIGTAQWLVTLGRFENVIAMSALVVPGTGHLKHMK